MNVTDNEAALLPIVIAGYTFKPNADGLWSLTEINKQLPKITKPPAQWRGRDRDYFDNCADLHSLDGRAGGTYATERATIAYAMSCSLDFYVMVVDAFVTMRNDAILSSRMASLALAGKDALLAENIPKAEAFMHKAGTIGLSWSEACRAAGVQYPGLAKGYLVSKGRFISKDHPAEHRKILRPTPVGFSLGLFKACSTEFGNADGFRVTAKGLVWLEEKSKEINDACRLRNAEKAKEVRAKKSRNNKGGTK